MKKVVCMILTITLILSMAVVPGYANGAKAFTPPGLAKKGGLPPGLAKKFIDIDGYDWALKAIEKMALKGVIKGVGEEKFAPAASVTKVEALTMIIKTMGWGEEADQYLKEIKAGKKADKAKERVQDWGKGVIEVALEKHLIDEVDVAQQNFNTPATRQEVAQYIIRALGKAEAAQDKMNVTLRFTDTKAIQLGAVGYIYLIDELGIMKGYPDHTFKPNKPVTRAEMAKLAEALDEQLEDEDADDDDNNEWERVVGSIRSVDDDSIELRLETGRLISYEVSEDVMVYDVNNKRVSLDSIKKEMRVQLDVYDEEVKIISVLEQIVSNKFTGIITKINRNELFMKEGNTEKKLIMNSATIVVIDGKAADRDDLEVGMQATAQLENDKVIKVSATTIKDEYKGAITKIVDEDTFKIKIGNIEKTIHIDSNTVVTLDRKVVELEDLIVGSQVTVQLENDKVIKVSATTVRNEYKGEITKIVDSNTLKVKIGIIEQSFDIDDSTEITIDDKATAFAQLVQGMQVKITILNGKVAQVEAESIETVYEGKLIRISEYKTKQLQLTIQMAGSKEKEFIVEDNEGNRVLFENIGKIIELKLVNSLVEKITIKN